MDCDFANDIPGAKELVDWFGSIPSFHDAYLVELRIGVDGTALLKIRTFRTTRDLDDKGHYVLDWHCFVTFIIDGLEEAHLLGFLPGEGILFDLGITKTSSGFKIAIDSSYGVNGALFARNIRVEFEPIPQDQ